MKMLFQIKIKEDMHITNFPNKHTHNNKYYTDSLCVMIPDWLELCVMIPDWLELSVMIPDWLELSVMIPDWLELSTEGVHELCESGVPLELRAGAAITLVSHHDAMEVVVERPEPVLLEQLQAMVETERQCKVSLHHTKGEALKHRVETVHVKKMKQG